MLQTPVPLKMGFAKNWGLARIAKPLDNFVRSCHNLRTIGDRLNGGWDTVPLVSSKGLVNPQSIKYHFKIDPYAQPDKFGVGRKESK